MAYTFLDLAHDVLKTASSPLTYGEIWKMAKDSGLAEKVSTKGATPWTTLSARLSSEILHKPESRFIVWGSRPQRYFLKSRRQEIPDQPPQIVPEDPPVDGKVSYREKDLHPLLACFVHTNPGFMGERQVYAKTIAHERVTSRRGLSEWSYPDMVGVYFPFGDLEDDVIDLSKSLGANSAQIFSFELKRSIVKGNYRQYFFQAVSNSSWAHEGYLVAPEISEDEDLRSELERLTNAFGIGIIHLNLADIHSSRILFRAENKSDLDWDTISKLCKENKDFRDFVDRLNRDFRAGEVRTREYDAIVDPVRYIKEKLKIETAE